MRPGFHYGQRISYECDLGYKAIGTTDLECLSTGYWSDYPPKCLVKDEYCSEPAPISNGFFMCQPSQCDSFKVGTELRYFCSRDFKLDPEYQGQQICLPGGIWTVDPPRCISVESANTYMAVFSKNKAIIIVTTSCALLGLLTLVLLAVVLQRRRACCKRRRHQSRSRVPTLVPDGDPSVDSHLVASPYLVPAGCPETEQDRLALIAFADDLLLPSYEDAIRQPLHQPRGPRLADVVGSRFILGAGHNPSVIRPLMRDAPLSTPVDNRRNSTLTSASTNISVTAGGFGSMDTVNNLGMMSDATSTSVTVDTYDSMASNPSLTASQRVTLGSLDTSSTHGSLTSAAAHDNRSIASGPAGDVPHSPLLPHVRTAGENTAVAGGELGSVKDD